MKAFPELETPSGPLPSRIELELEFVHPFSYSDQFALELCDTSVSGTYGGGVVTRQVFTPQPLRTEAAVQGYRANKPRTQLSSRYVDTFKLPWPTWCSSRVRSSLTLGSDHPLVANASPGKAYKLRLRQVDSSSSLPVVFLARVITTNVPPLAPPTKLLGHVARDAGTPDRSGYPPPRYPTSRAVNPYRKILPRTDGEASQVSIPASCSALHVEPRLPQRHAQTRDCSQVLQIIQEVDDAV